MEKDDIYAITEVYYILERLPSCEQLKIPSDLYEFFEKNYDKTIYIDLNINNLNINEVSNQAKLLLKIISIFLK